MSVDYVAPGYWQDGYTVSLGGAAQAQAVSGFKSTAFPLAAADYAQQLSALLPFGPAWEFDAGSVGSRLLSAWADELARVHARCEQIVNEGDPRATYEMLADYEILFGLPDACLADIDQSDQQRRNALTSKIISSGGQSREYFISLAVAMGYPDASINEFRLATCNDDCEMFLNGTGDVFVWQLILPVATGSSIIYMNCESVCTDSLQAWGDEAIECRIGKLRPAHTTVLFAYP